MEELRRKATRKSGSKVKSGCVTCKARRVKCDQQKPACLKCTASNKKCEGYADPFRSEIPMAPGPRTSANHARGHSSSRPTSDLQLGLGSVSSLPLDAEERRYFHHFRQSCLPVLLGLVDAEFWNRYILQHCASKPAVHHATLALSAQHKAFLTRSLDSDEECSPENERSSAFSWNQYSKAIKSLRCQLGHSSVNAKNVEETLIVCLLFVVFGVLQGNYREALMHLEGGLQIITDCYPSAPLTTKQFSKDFSDSSLARAFRRLDIQAASYVSSRNVKLFSPPLFSQSRQSVLASQSVLEFTNLHEACDTLNVRVASVYRFMRSPAPSLSKHSYLSSKWVMDLKYEPLLQVAEAKENTFSGVLQEQKLHITALRSWAFAFEAFLKRLTARTSHAERTKFEIRTGELAQQYAVLWISYLVIFTTLATIFEPDESAFDRFLPHFEKIVEHAEFVLFHNIRDNEFPAGRRFSMEMNVTQPLYFTALKCRNHSLRHHAAALLHVSGQEGVWDGSMLSAITKYIIEIEESEGYVEICSESSPIAELALEPDHQKLVILEPARVHGVSLEILDRIKGKVGIEFSKRNFTSTKPVIEQVEGFETYEWVYDKKLLEGWKESFSLPE